MVVVWLLAHWIVSLGIELELSGLAAVQTTALCVFVSDATIEISHPRSVGHDKNKEDVSNIGLIVFRIPDCKAFAHESREVIEARMGIRVDVLWLIQTSH